jgi:hypothetical protein
MDWWRNAYELYLEAPRFESRPEHRLSRLRFLVVYLSHFIWMLGQYFETGHGRFLPNHFKSTKHHQPFIWLEAKNRCS